MSNNKPKVSIIIPVYNGADYLSEAIDSALAQTYDNVETIVVNDGSTDGGETERVAKKYGDRIRYFCKDNGGVSSALNYGIKEMSGVYFSWLSHDDKYEPEKLEECIDILSNYDFDEKVIALVGGYYIDSKSNRLKDFPVRFEENVLNDGSSVINTMLLKGTLNGCCMLIHKNAFTTCGGFDEGLRYNQDALMWHKIFCNGFKLVYRNKRDVMYRFHQNQTSKLRRDLYIHDTIKSSDELIPLFSESSSEKYRNLYLYARRVAISNCVEVVKRSIAYGVSHKSLDVQERIKLSFYTIYGYIRNSIRSLRNKVMR